MKTLKEVWNEEAWGSPEMYGLNMEKTSYDGFSLGDHVEAFVDGNEEAGEYFYEGEAGVVVGIHDRPNGLFASAATEIIVAFEGMDPIGVEDPYDKLRNLSR